MKKTVLSDSFHSLSHSLRAVLNKIFVKVQAESALPPNVLCLVSSLISKQDICMLGRYLIQDPKKLDKPAGKFVGGESFKKESPILEDHSNPSELLDLWVNSKRKVSPADSEIGYLHVSVFSGEEESKDRFDKRDGLEFDQGRALAWLFENEEWDLLDQANREESKGWFSQLVLPFFFELSEQAKIIAAGKPITKSAMNFEKATIEGKTPGEVAALKQQLETIPIPEELNHLRRHPIGQPLPRTELRAIRAIQNILTDKDYKTDIQPYILSPEDQKEFELNSVPNLVVSIPAFLEAYGLERRRSSRGKLEWPSSGRAEAIGALDSLASKYFGLSWNRGTSKDPKQVVRWTPVVGVIKKRSKLTITAHPVLLDKVDKYFVSYPRNLPQMIQKMNPADRGVAQAFQEFLYRQDRQKTGKNGKPKDRVIRFGLLIFAQRVGGFERMIAAKKWSKVEERILRCLNQSVALGSLEKFAVEKINIHPIFECRLPPKMPRELLLWSDIEGVESDSNGAESDSNGAESDSNGVESDGNGADIIRIPLSVSNLARNISPL